MPVNRLYTAEMPARRTTGPCSSGFLKAALLSVVSAAMMWRQRAHDRAHLRDLEPHHLDDIGMSPERRAREVRKPFWVR